MLHLGPGVFKSPLCTLTSFGLRVYHHLLQTEASLMSMRDTFICSFNGKSSGVGLLPRSLCRIIAEGSALALMTCLNIVLCLTIVPGMDFIEQDFNPIREIFKVRTKHYHIELYMGAYTCNFSTHVTKRKIIRSSRTAWAI